MTHQSICSAAARAVTPRQRRLLVGALACLASANACVSDVQLPDCIVNDTCGQAGQGGGSPGAAGASQAGSAVQGGTSAGVGGAVGDSGAGNEAGGASGFGAAGDAGEAGAGGASDCEDCRIQPPELPAGCQGQPYQTTILADMGTPPYQWQLTPPITGWSIDSRGPTSASLQAEVVLPGKTDIGVTVTDGAGRRAVANLRLLARTSCWFAYTALEKAGDGAPAQGQLHLLDPIDERRKIEPEHNEAIYDFQFSPDGTRLVYSYAATPTAPRGRHLSLIDIASQSEQALSFGEDAIHSFAWSPDSSTLAVAFVSQGGTKLGGVRLPENGLLSTPTSLNAVAAHVESDLSWVGNELVAYHAELLPKAPYDGTFVDNPLRLHTAFYSPLGASGFGAEAPARGAFASGVRLRPTDAGFYMISDGVPGTSFYPLAGTVGAGREHDEIALLSPSGKLSAILWDGSPLTLQSAERGAVPPSLAVAAAEDTCDLVLAWAEDKERIACVANVMNADETFHGEVHVFDLTPSGDGLVMTPLEGYCEDDTSLVNQASCIKASGLKYSYDIDSARNAARAFSPSGRWFAFTRVTEHDVYLYVGEVGAQQAALTRKIPIPASSPSQPTSLAFSRDERLLFVQAGDWLQLLEVGGARRSYPLVSKLAVGDECTEQFTSKPDAYCGNTERAGLARWAPDSKSLAYRTPDALTVLDVTAEALGVHARVVPDCQQACSGRFAFQPH